MTIFEAQTVLIKWFAEKDTVTLGSNDKVKDDFTKLVTLSENPPQDRAAILLALEDLKEAGWIKRHDDKNCSYFILIKPLASITQMVPIDIVLASDIAELVNDLAPTDKICEPTRIDSYDIQALLMLIYQLLEDCSEGNTGEDGESPSENITNN